MAGTRLSAFKGHLTRKIRPKGLTAKMLFGILTKRKDVIKTKAELQQILIDDYGVSPESEFFKRVTVDAHGRVKMLDIETDKDAETFYQIDEYRVPPGTWVKRDAIKSWIKTKGIHYQQTSVDVKPFGLGDTRKSAIEQEEEKIDRLAYLIARKWYREGYTAQMKIQLDDEGNEIEYRNKHAPNYILDRFGKIEKIEKI